MIGVVAAAAVEALLVSGGIALFIGFAILDLIVSAVAPIRVISVGCGSVIAVLVRTRAVSRQAVLTAVIDAVFIARAAGGIAIPVAVIVTVPVTIMVAMPVAVAVLVLILVLIVSVLRLRSGKSGCGKNTAGNCQSKYPASVS